MRIVIGSHESVDQDLRRTNLNRGRIRFPTGLLLKIGVAIMFKRWKFTILLLSLLLMFATHPLADRRDLFSPLYKAVYLLVYIGALVALFQRQRSRIVATILATPTILGGLFHSLIPSNLPHTASIALHLAPILFFGYTTIIILRTIFQDANVSMDSINGAFSGYVLLGLAFAHAYCLLESFQPNSFIVSGDGVSVQGREGPDFSVLTYYSLITLTTVGYGDIVPRAAAARSLACIEAVMGQFYVAVIVAELIALRVSAAMQESRPEEKAPKH